MPKVSTFIGQGTSIKGTVAPPTLKIIFNNSFFNNSSDLSFYPSPPINLQTYLHNQTATVLKRMWRLAGRWIFQPSILQVIS